VVGDTFPPRCLHFAVPRTSPAAGSGLIGLRDRVQALGGSIEVNSSAGDGRRSSSNFRCSPTDRAVPLALMIGSRGSMAGAMGRLSW
jgi:hypothetical protein